MNEWITLYFVSTAQQITTQYGWTKLVYFGRAWREPTRTHYINLHNSFNNCLLMGINSWRGPLVWPVHVEACEESIFKADLNILQYRYLTGVYINCRLLRTKITHVYKCELQNKETSIQLEHRLEDLGVIPKCKCIVPFRLGYPLLWTSTSRQSSRGVHNFGRESPYFNISSQLGREAHNFGHKFPYTNISSQLGWGVYNFGRKSRCTNISSQLGWGVHNFGHKSPYINL